MLTDRTETNRVFADQEEVTGPWRQDRAHPSAHPWSRRAVDSRITGSLLRASRWKEQPVARGGLN